MNSNLKQIFWLSNTALERFKNVFAKDYRIPEAVLDKVLNISSVLYPCTETYQKTITNTSYNHLITTFTEENFYRKGGDIIVDVVKKLQKINLPEWQLTIVGSIPFQHQDIFVRGNINILPRVSYEKFQELMKQADIFLFPSRADTFGLSCLEAMNFGLYVIAATGQSVFATKEYLKDYPNCYIFEALGNDGIYDILNPQLFLDFVEDLIRNPKPLLPFSSPFTPEEMKQNFLLGISY